MARVILIFIFLWTCLVSTAFAGEITDIGFEKKPGEEYEVMIKGTYASYRAFTLQSPFRFIIDLEEASLGDDLPRSIDVKGKIISKIRAGQGEKRARIVIDSAKAKEPFHANIQEKATGLLVKCWRAEEDDKVAGKKPEKTGDPSLTDAPAVHKKTLSDLFGKREQKPREKESLKGKKVETFTGQKITLDFYKTDIHNVFRIFAEVSGKNIIVDERVSGEVTLALKQVPWDLAMDIILEMKKLRKEEKADTFIISPQVEKEAGRGELSVRGVSEEALRPARLAKQNKKNRQKAQTMIVEAHDLEEKGRREEALTLYEKAYKLWKTNTDLGKKTAYLHYVEENFAKSYYYSGETLRLNPKDAEAALYAALSAARMGKDEEAEILFEAALKGSPKLPQVYYNYGLFLEKRYNYGKALYLYKKYEKIFGPSLNVELAIARLLDARDETEKACLKYKEIRNSGLHMGEQTAYMVEKKIETLCPQGEM